MKKWAILLILSMCFINLSFAQESSSQITPPKINNTNTGAAATAISTEVTSANITPPSGEKNITWQVCCKTVPDTNDLYEININYKTGSLESTQCPAGTVMYGLLTNQFDYSYKNILFGFKIPIPLVYTITCVKLKTTCTLIPSTETCP